MIIGGDKRLVVANIKQAVQNEQWHLKVEVDDPVLSPAAQSALIEAYLQRLDGPTYRTANWVANQVATSMTAVLNRTTTFHGLENLAGIGASIITSNHFNPLENSVIRAAMRRTGRRHLAIVSETTNLAMTGPVGFLMRYADTIPIATEPEYMGRLFPKLLQQELEQQRQILIYPEQEMWFNYRKPRPPKRGPYYYAARFNVPIVSCFVSMTDLGRPDNDQFNQIHYTGNVLSPIYPDHSLSVRENSQRMMAIDWQQKKVAYEQAYGEAYTPTWQSQDIVGWRG
ncbi:1-acyl-sn-glycerol-3-phosphate acyltransferase [Lactiplantibacillus sp. WILCCON 0030]|uniref:1-acyl-sn-glycerol-3-phosphate acyltransferase n=1 Tax=Lactiplantibacillus brownii TaxID=3069269 RepID=A0ABU1ABH6_9LACO|nr:1-acyl-sn-glycerol-3-phosphate acyltransferase [Lactiplantibacillus brownii]MDQ7938284.1 1-acyl-sn-glycerol-3-phosphate acyltransferase [Lactiplantibacillus brownii]